MTFGNASFLGRARSDAIPVHVFPDHALAQLRETVQPGVAVDAETIVRLQAYLRLLDAWQKAKNLVSAGTLQDAWERHILDSAQLLRYGPANAVWLDLGSGAGFPGMVLAILMAKNAGSVQLVEANGRKTAFLRAVSRETGIPVRIHHARAEDLSAQETGPIGIVTARAFAPLTKLIAYAAPWFAKGAYGLFLKGEGVDNEIEDAAKSHRFQYDQFRNAVTPGGSVLKLWLDKQP